MLTWIFTAIVTNDLYPSVLPFRNAPFKFLIYANDEFHTLLLISFQGSHSACK
uniref:Uncharacterized protein n=1 Tax=Rhizophora mucronata TaxID=61149 RepID=A0A2P2PFZ5_RHIMU